MDSENRRKGNCSAKAKNRILSHPGKILAEEFLKPLGLSATALALALRVPANRITAIINGERAVTLPWTEAMAAAKGTDVYLFLIGMMLLAEVARKEGLFDWLAAQAVRYSRGSAKRLFLIVYIVGTVVTVLLSNDATAVVLTPTVISRAAEQDLDSP
jgi:addiction module HigA family antidote